MRIIAVVAVAAIAFGAYNHWQKRPAPGSEASTATGAVSAHGFVSLPIDAIDPDVVLVGAAENCPKEDARRADRLAEDLSRSGVRVQRAHSVSFSSNDPDAFGHINAVMNGSLPIVFVRGNAKANPTLEEVLAEYKG